MRQVTPRTPNQARPLRAVTPERFLDELAGDGLDLGLRLLVVDSIATMLAPGNTSVARDEVEIFFTHFAFLLSLRDALDLVVARAADRRVARVLASDAPLGAYMKGLYLRASAVVRALELFGFHALDEAPERAAFARTVAHAATFHFPDLRDSIRGDLATLALELGPSRSVGRLRDAVEHLFVVSASLQSGGWSATDD